MLVVAPHYVTQLGPEPFGCMRTHVYRTFAPDAIVSRVVWVAFLDPT